jgi:hypothetical protein
MQDDDSVGNSLRRQLDLEKKVAMISRRFHGIDPA